MRKSRILLVEDDPHVVGVVTEYLASERWYESQACGTGEEALRQFSDNVPDLVLLDLGLPDMPGLDVCYSMKHHPFAKYVPVLILTGSERRGDLIDAFEAGADDYIIKPVFLEELLARVRAHLRVKHLCERMDQDRTTLQQILNFTGTILRSGPQDDVYQSILEQLRVLFNSRRVSLLLPESGGELLRVLSSTDSATVGGLQLEMWRYPEVQHSIETREVVMVRDIRSNRLMSAVAEHLAEVDLRSVLVIPIFEGDELHATLLLRRSLDQPPFEERDLWLCQLIGHALGALLRNTSLHLEFERKVQQLTETRDRLLKSERLSSLGQFVAGIAKELSAPLTSIASYSRLLMRGQQNPYVRQGLNRVLQQAEHCSGMVRNLLTFSETYSAEKNRVDLADVLQLALQDRSRRFDMAGIQVRIALEPRLPPIMASKHQLQQVFGNLFDNAAAALAHAAEPPCLSISARVREAEIELLVHDNGPGMREEVRSRVFEAYFTTSTMGSGTGLGLTIVKGIVEDHGGKIDLSSSPGRGTTVTIHFPLAQAVERESVEKLPEEAVGFSSSLGHGVAADDTKSKSVLLVDDERSILEALSTFLKHCQFEVGRAATGRQAMELCREKRFDVLFIDMKLPDMSGEQLYQRLVDVDPEIEGRFIFSSGDPYAARQRLAMQRIEERFLAKPFTFDQLLAQIGETLRPRVTEVP